MQGNKKVQELWNITVKFDVVITESFNSDCALGLAYNFETTLVGVTSHVLVPWHYERFAIRDINTVFPLTEGGTNPILFQRLERTICHFYFDWFWWFEYFDNIPPLEELARAI